MKGAAISVIVPVYNKADKLPRALDSALRQSLENIEIIVVDDGSEDESLQVASAYSLGDPRILVLQQDNAGSGFARNKGIKQASGEYIAFLDPDDWLPDDDVYECLFAAAKQSGLPIAGGNIERVDDDGTSWGVEATSAFDSDAIRRFSETEDCAGFTRYIYRRDLLMDHGIRFPSWRRAQDNVFLTRVMEVADEFHAIPKAVYSYQRGFGHVSWTPRVVADLCGATLEILNYATDHGYRYMYNANAAMLLDLSIVVALYGGEIDGACVDGYVRALNSLDASWMTRPRRLKSFQRIVMRLEKRRLTNPRKMRAIYAATVVKYQLRGQIVTQLRKRAPALAWKLMATTGRTTGRYANHALGDSHLEMKRKG